MLSLALILAATSVPLYPDGLVVRIKDGDAVRDVERASFVRGTAHAPVNVRYIDPATGRAADTWLTDTAIVRAHDIDVVAATHDLVVRAPLMRRIGLWLVTGAAGEDGLDVAARLQARGVFAFPNLAFLHTTYEAAAPSPPFIPNDPRYPAQFYHRELRMEQAWSVTTGSPDVRVTVVDNGCDLSHPDLAAKFEAGHDVVSNDDDPSYAPNRQGNEHGTACAGLVAAITNNDRDIAGACPECRLRCTRLLPDVSEPVPLDADVRAFDFALEDDDAVVSNSWGFVEAIPVPIVLRDAIIEVQQNGRGGKGAVVVFASGNDSREIGDDELLAVAGVLGVGATNNLGELTQFSNRGRSVDVTAPTGTLSTDISGPDGASDGDVTATFGGTSSAAPLVAGIAGLILSARPDLTADELNDLLQRTAEQSPFARPDADGHDLEYGFGLVRADLALDEAIGTIDQPQDDPNCDNCGSTNTAPALVAALIWRRRRRRSCGAR